MSARKKEFEDSVVIFKQESGQSKGDAWLTYETKVTGVANNLYPDHTPSSLSLINSMTKSKIGV